jgi:hypothetical protein
MLAMAAALIRMYITNCDTLAYLKALVDLREGLYGFITDKASKREGHTPQAHFKQTT